MFNSQQLSTFLSVLSESCDDFDFHRDRFTPALNDIKNVGWIEVDAVKYDNKFINPIIGAPISELEPPPLLRSSRYGHYSFVKCFPDERTCVECYKYFCPCCSQGTNCMYGERCTTRRCSIMLNKYHSDIYDIESYKKRVFVYKVNNISFFEEKVASICPRSIYGY